MMPCSGAQSVAYSVLQKCVNTRMQKILFADVCRDRLSPVGELGGIGCIQYFIASPKFPSPFHQVVKLE